MKSKNSDLKISIGKIYKDSHDNYWVIGTSEIDKVSSQKLYVGFLLAERSYNLFFLENGEGWIGTTNLIEELQCHKCIIHEINKKENEEEIRKLPLKLIIKYLENENIYKCIIHEINKKENEEEIRKLPLKLRIKYLENENI